MKKLNRNFVLYAIIGLSGVTLDVLLFLVLFNLFHINELLATFISISAAITNNFLLNTRFNFRVRDRLWGRYARFYLVGLSGIVLTDLLFLIFVNGLHINANIIKIGSLLPVLLLQYSLNKRWSFREETVIDATNTEEA
jgi:putative flippase GtrA